MPEPRINENNRIFRDACQRLGYSVRQFPVNVKGCRGEGVCNLGCPNGAKQGTAQVQLPVAVAAGVTLISGCRVERIDGHDILATVEPPPQGLAASTLPPGQHRFRARRIVVCAGTLHTTPLLLRSFGKDRWPVLGRYFTCHPALVIPARHPRAIDGIFGHPKSFYSDQFFESEKFLLETCIYWPFTLAKSVSALGKELDEFLNPFNRLQMILALAEDDALAENRIDAAADGKPRVHYTVTPAVIRALVRSMQAAAEVFFEAGAEQVHAPASRAKFLRPADRPRLRELITEAEFKLGQVSIASAHPMGGCRMGEDPAVSVTSPWGQLHGVDHVYVADASLFPAASGVNPYLTVMALADRVAEGLARDINDSTKAAV